MTKPTKQWRKIVDGTVLCNSCMRMRPLEEFQERYNPKTNTKGLEPYCNPCRHLRLRLNNLNMTRDEYNIMLDRAGYACEACGSEDRLVVDHEHDTGKLRGILCAHCNTALGCARDNADRLRALADYSDAYATLLASRPPTPQDAERERRMKRIRELSADRHKRAQAAIKQPKRDLSQVRMGRAFKELNKAS